jgi:ribonuclease J
VLALMADSTNADEPGWTPSEAVIDPAFDNVFRGAPGRILIGSFASLVSRMQQVANAAHRHGRVMAFVGTSMVENAKMAGKLGYLDVPDGLIVNLDQALKMKPSKVVLMCTGTQGEPSSILGRLSKGSNRQFDIAPGDTVVLSSTPIPGNEEMVHRTINRLFQRGAEVIYDAIAPVHVSGHASQEEMKLLIQLVKPQHLIPIHGELRHLKQHAALARELGLPKENIAVVENGTPIEFRDGKISVAERVPGGYVFVDGSGVGDIGPSVMREREALARDGFVLVHLVFDCDKTHLLEDPEIITKGFVFVRDAEKLIEQASEHVHELVNEGALENIETRIEEGLSKFFYNETRRRPMVFVFTSIDRGG